MLIAREILKVIVVLLVEAVVDETKKQRGRTPDPPEIPPTKGAKK